MNADSSTVPSLAATTTSVVVSWSRSDSDTHASRTTHTTETSVILSHQNADVPTDPIALDVTNRFITPPQTFRIMSPYEISTYKPGFQSIFASWCKVMAIEGQLRGAMAFVANTRGIIALQVTQGSATIESRSCGMSSDTRKKLVSRGVCTGKIDPLFDSDHPWTVQPTIASCDFEIKMRDGTVLKVANPSIHYFHHESDDIHRTIRHSKFPALTLAVQLCHFSEPTWQQDQDSGTDYGIAPTSAVDWTGSGDFQHPYINGMSYEAGSLHPSTGLISAPANLGYLTSLAPDGQLIPQFGFGLVGDDWTVENPWSYPRTMYVELPQISAQVGFLGEKPLSAWGSAIEDRFGSEGVEDCISRISASRNRRFGLKFWKGLNAIQALGHHFEEFPLVYYAQSVSGSAESLFRADRVWRQDPIMAQAERWFSLVGNGAHVPVANMTIQYGTSIHSLVSGLGQEFAIIGMTLR